MDERSTDCRLETCTCMRPCADSQNSGCTSLPESGGGMWRHVPAAHDEWSKTHLQLFRCKGCALRAAAKVWYGPALHNKVWVLPHACTAAAIKAATTTLTSVPHATTVGRFQTATNQALKSSTFAIGSSPYSIRCALCCGPACDLHACTRYRHSMRYRCQGNYNRPRSGRSSQQRQGSRSHTQGRQVSRQADRTQESHAHLVSTLPMLRPCALAQ